MYPFPTVCPRSSDPFYIVTYYIKWVTTSWTYIVKKFGQPKELKESVLEINKISALLLGHTVPILFQPFMLYAKKNYD